VLLNGTLPQAITSAPLVLVVYAVLILLVVNAVTSVLVRNSLWAIGAFASGMVLLALLYLTIAPFLLFAVQLLIYTTVSAGLLLGLLRQTTSLQRPPDSPFNNQWIGGAAVAAALGALLVVVLGATSWPATACCGLGVGEALVNAYVVALATLVVLVASAALGVGLLLATPRLARRPGRPDAGNADLGRRRQRDARP
jgi:NADH:ubiquinone oxidoreductase subunit 6 (subunit J)